MPTVEVEVYHEWWEFDTDTFPLLSLPFPPHGGILSWWEYAGIIVIVIIILSSVKLIIFDHQSLGRLRRQILGKFHWSRFLSSLLNIYILHLNLQSKKYFRGDEGIEAGRRV